VISMVVTALGAGAVPGFGCSHHPLPSSPTAAVRAVRLASVARAANPELPRAPTAAQLQTFHRGRASFLATPVALSERAEVSPSRTRPKAGTPTKRSGLHLCLASADRRLPPSYRRTSSRTNGPVSTDLRGRLEGQLMARAKARQHGADKRVQQVRRDPGASLSAAGISTISRRTTFLGGTPDDFNDSGHDGVSGRHTRIL
jgi:hypothetical protein